MCRFAGYPCRLGPVSPPKPLSHTPFPLYRFAGYAGWGAGQLQAECQRGVWFTAAASPELLILPTSGSPEGDSEGERDPSSGKEYWHKVWRGM